MVHGEYSLYCCYYYTNTKSILKKNHNKEKILVKTAKITKTRKLVTKKLFFFLFRSLCFKYIFFVMISKLVNWSFQPL